MINKLLRKNISGARIAGFVVANFLGLAIVLGAVQFYLDARGIWSDDDSFLRSDYMVINKRVTSQNTLGGSTGFSPEELAELSDQPWQAGYAPFTAADYRVFASVMRSGRGMSTNMFLESIPDEFLDVSGSAFQWHEGNDEIPVIISKDYLALYNFGFATSAGLPQMSEGLMGGIPLTMELSSDDGMRRMTMHGRIVGFSNRLNTILVPQSFMDYSNSKLGSSKVKDPSRLIIKVSKPGDVAIKEYLDAHDYEVAGDKSATSASFLLRVVVGVVMGIGSVITLLSFFILLLSISLLMEKNRDKIHSLLMLGYNAGTISTPYIKIVVSASVTALAAGFAGVMALRHFYIGALKGLGAETGSWWPTIIIGLVLTVLIIIFNIISVRRRVNQAWRHC